MSFSGKKAGKQGKILLLTILESAVTFDEQYLYDPLYVLKALHLIFGFGNKVIHTSGISYHISGPHEFAQLLSAMPSTSRLNDAVTATRFESTETQTEPAEVYEQLFMTLFRTLRQQGYELEYHQNAENPLLTDLQRADSLIGSLKQFISLDLTKEAYIDEYISLKQLDLENLQYQLRDKILLSKFAGFAPGSLLTAYYKVYGKLPRNPS